MDYLFQLIQIKSDDIFCISGEVGELGRGSYGIVFLGFHKKEKLIAAKCSKIYGGIEQKNILEKRYDFICTYYSLIGNCVSHAVGKAID